MLSVERQVTDSVITLWVKGVLDYATIGTFHESLVDWIEYSAVVLDFSGMEFTDSTGIGAVLEIIYSAYEHERHVELRGLTKDMKNVFETVGVFEILQALQGDN